MLEHAYAIEDKLKKLIREVGTATGREIASGIMPLIEQNVVYLSSQIYRQEIFHLLQQLLLALQEEAEKP